MSRDADWPWRWDDLVIAALIVGTLVAGALEKL